MKTKDYRICELFNVKSPTGDIQTTKHLIETKDLLGDEIPLVTAGKKQRINGYAGYVDKEGDGKAKIIKGNTITVDMFCKAYYQPVAYYAVTHARVSILEPKFEMDEYLGLYFVTLIDNESFRFNYGRASYKNCVKNLVIHVPVNDDDTPDWDYMRNTIKNTNIFKFFSVNNNEDPISGVLANISKSHNRLSLNGVRTKLFAAKSLFKFKKGISYEKSQRSDGETPYVSSSSLMNGVCDFVDDAPLHSGNLITVASNGSVGEAFYQPKPFIASSDVTVLYPKGWNLNPYIALYICVAIRGEQFRYHWGRKLNLERLKPMQLRLPVTNDGTPDWEFMEQYIKSIPGASII